MTFAVFLSIPAILLKPIGNHRCCSPIICAIQKLPVRVSHTLDYYLVRYGLLDREYQTTNIIKRFIAKTVLLVSGIDVVQEGLDKEVRYPMFIV